MEKLFLLSLFVTMGISNHGLQGSRVDMLNTFDVKLM